MKVLIACEESQTVCKAFRKLGHEAYSCDTLDCSGGKLQWHIKDDVLKHLNKDWDLMIAHPPCTYLSYAGIRHWNNIGRKELREKAMAFFLTLWNAPIKRICVENPVGYPNTVFRKPDQIIHPYYFGEPFQKRTCLWLKELPKLDYEKTIIQKPEPLYICKGKKCYGKKIHFTEGIKGLNHKERSRIRSKTFEGIAKAMAKQWGKLNEVKCRHSSHE